MKKLLLPFLPLLATAQSPENFTPYATDSFLGDYGFVPNRTEVEPRISRDDYSILEQARELSKNELPAAIQLLQTKVSGDPLCSSVFNFSLATLLYQQNRPTEAIRQYKATLDKTPNFLRARRNLAYVQIHQEAYAEAAINLSKSLNLGDASADTYGMLGYCQLMEGNHSSAENAYRFALVRDPGNTAIQNGLVRCLEAMGRHKEVISLLDELIYKNPGDTAYWLTQVNSLNQTGEHRRAIANIEMLRRTGKASGPSLLVLGDLYLNLELPTRAHEAYSAAMETQGNLPPGHFIRAAIQLANQNAYELAIQYANTIQIHYGTLLEKEDRLRFLHLRARLALQAEQYTQAVQYLENLLQDSPLDGAALLLLGKTYARLEDPIRAAIAFERAAKTNSHAPDALLEHARMLVNLEDYQAGLQLLRQAQQIQPRSHVEAYLLAVEKAAQSQRSLDL